MVPLSVLTVLSIVGFQFTAVQLATRLQWTCFLLLGLAYLHALALRWVVISRRRLAIEQARARLAHASDHTDAAPGTLEAQANLQEIDLHSVDVQTRRLVWALTIAVGAIAFWPLCVDVLPALSRFDEITAWDTQVLKVVANDGDAALGSSMTTVIAVESVTYADVFIATLIFVALYDLLFFNMIPDIVTWIGAGVILIGAVMLALREARLKPHIPWPHTSA